MRIVIFSSYFLPHKGGVENYVYQTAKRLAKRHKVFVVTTKLRGTKSEEVMDGVQVIRLPGVEVLPSTMNVQIPLLKRVTNKVGKIDVVVTHTRFYPLTLVGGMLAKLGKIPWLHIEHGTKQVVYDNPLVRFVSRAVDATTGTWILRSARVAGVSEASCAFTRKFGAKSCTVLYNGVDTKFFDGKLKKHNDIRIVFVGRLIQEKGVQDLLKAAKGLGEIVIIGKGPYESELRKHGGKFVGEKDSKGVRKVLSECDILVNPSYGEGLPTSVLEAGAMGLAVVATDVGGTSEIISDGKNGFLVHPGDVKQLRARLQRLVKDAALRAKLGVALQKTVREKFDWDKIVVKLEKVLKEL